MAHSKTATITDDVNIEATTRAAIDESARFCKPLTSVSPLGIYGDCEIIPAAMEATRSRLRALPSVFLRSRELDGAAKMLLDCEIRVIKNALTGIFDDPYYRIIPDLYFHRMTCREASIRMNCDKSTVWRNEERLVSKLALLLYGTDAWRIYPAADYSPPYECYGLER